MKDLNQTAEKGTSFSLVQKKKKDLSIHRDETTIEEYPKSIWKN